MPISRPHYPSAGDQTERKPATDPRDQSSHWFPDARTLQTHPYMCIKKKDGQVLHAKVVTAKRL